MTILNRQVILAATTASTNGYWYPMDYRNDVGGTIRSFVGNITSGDSVNVLLTNDAITDVNGVPTVVSVLCTATTYTDTTFVYSILGPFSAIRFDKVGSNGPAKVVALL